ncbi:RNA-directed DNA polymerase, eukaryota, reverse transcriptase zinc-binding domain protein, partial [Tanacetum coccineum]
MKEDIRNILVWVKLHGVPVTDFYKDGLSVIATKIGTPLMLDSYTSDMCLQSWDKSSYARAMIELRADEELKDTIVECPKNIGVGVAKNLKKSSQTSRGVPVGPKVGFKPHKEYRPVPKKATANSSGNKKKCVEPTNEVSNSNPFDVLNTVDNDIELGTNGRTSNSAILVDEDGNPLKKVEYPGDHDSEDEVASVDNHMARSIVKAIKNTLSSLATTSDVTRHSIQSTGNGSMSPYFPHRLIFQWVWRREPRPGPETEELISLVSLLSNLYLSNVEDRWECTIDASRRFTVKGMRSFITSMSHSVSSTVTCWNKVVPLKININTWRVLNGRMATRANLDRRGIDLDSVRCPICDDVVETEEHLFVDCKIARDTWINVLNWWRIPNTTFQSLQDVFQLADDSPLEVKFSRFFDAVIQTTIWSLWRFRNNVIFSLNKPSKDLLFNDIMILSFNWI